MLRLGERMLGARGLSETTSCRRICVPIKLPESFALRRLGEPTRPCQEICFPHQKTPAADHLLNNALSLLL
ncbi:MAG: hypothetical protein K2I16_11035 [Muribaculaceae bacterium]|nr:hypothetical protein [Muribaculaceae bacterium]